MMPTRPWVLAIGWAGAVFAATHAYTFRTIIESNGLSEDMSERLTFLGGAPALFVIWLVAAVLLWIVLIAMLPAVWRALGGGWAATVVVVLLFVAAATNLVGDGAQFPTLFLSTRYASAPEALRPGLEAAELGVAQAASTLLGPGILPLFVGSALAAVLCAVRRPPAGRWYGLLILLFALANIPLPGAIAFAALNLILFGAFTLATARVLRGETMGVAAASPS